MRDKNGFKQKSRQNAVKMKRILNWLDEKSTNHWIISSVLLVGSSWWFSLVIAFWGEQLHLIKINNGVKGFTALGVTITIIIFIIHVINTAIAKNRNETSDTKLSDMTASFNLLDKVMSSISQICYGKYSTQTKLIELIKQNKAEPPVIYSNPCMQFEIILKELISCLAFVLNTNEHRVKPESLYASIAYNFPEENDDIWKWVNVQKQQGLDISTLLNGESLLSSLINEQNKPYEFYNSKQTAFENHKYLKDDCDKLDKDGNLSGSIACFRISIKRSDITYIRAILSISSYDIQFVKEDNSDGRNQENIINTRENIRKIIISEFVDRIHIELCNYYLQFLRDRWEEQHKFRFK